MKISHRSLACAFIFFVAVLAQTVSPSSFNATRRRDKAKESAGAVFRPSGNVAFANVQGVFDRNCVRCHQGSAPPASLVLSAGEAYGNIVNVPSVEYPSWQRVHAGNHAISWLYEKIANQRPVVGSKMENLSADEIALIGAWIDQGAAAVPSPPYVDLEFRTVALPVAELNVTYNVEIVVWGGLPPYQFNVVSGDLPAGLNLDANLGRISGAPVETGAYSFTIQVNDSQTPAATLEQDYNLEINDSQLQWQLPADFRIQAVVMELDLPVNIAFVPNPGSNASDPYFYVTLLYGRIVMVQRDFQTLTYAADLLNFDPKAELNFAELGVIGILVEPNIGDVFASMAYDSAGLKFGKVVRFHSADGGRTAASQTTIFSGIPITSSHQIHALTIGPDGKLYLNSGDGFVPNAAQDLYDPRGKILRMNLDGTLPDDNPFAGSYTYTSGLRNPFGAAWRPSDHTLYVSDNGPGYDDRLIKVAPGGNYGWPDDLTPGALYLWNPTVSPVGIAFLRDTPFPPTYAGQLFVGLAGGTNFQGPNPRGKKIQAFALDDAGNVVSESTFLDYLGAGYSTVIGLAFGPDGLYFTDLNGKNGFDEFGRTHGNVYRIHWQPPDSLAPVISNVRVDSLAANRARVSWNTDEPATSSVEYGVTTNYGAAVTDAKLVTAHGLWLTGLTDSTLYHFRVRSQDSVSNETLSPDYAFKTLQAQFDLLLEAETMSVKTTGYESAPGWILRENGYLAEKVNFPRRALCHFTLRAFGKMAAGAWPQAELCIDQITNARITVADSNYAEWETEFTVNAGEHEVAIAFVNAYDQPPEQRYLGVDWLHLKFGEVITHIAVDPTSAASAVPSTFALHNYPNPFHGATRIIFALPEKSEIELAVFDVTGREVKKLLAGTQAAGNYEVSWDGRNRGDGELRSGIYLLRLRYRSGKNNFWAQIVRRVALVK
jgi:glucose/arabinose dehydrogenase